MRMVMRTSVIAAATVARVVASLMKRSVAEKDLERSEDRPPPGKKPIGYRFAQLLLLPEWPSWS